MLYFHTPPSLISPPAVCSLLLRPLPTCFHILRISCTSWLRWKIYGTTPSEFDFCPYLTEIQHHKCSILSFVMHRRIKGNKSLFRMPFFDIRLPNYTRALPDSTTSEKWDEKRWISACRSSCPTRLQLA